MTAWIAGTAVSLETAAAEAARLLRLARLPVIAGLATDVTGTRAAISLAEKLGGAYDHIASDALLRDLDVMRQAGLMITTPNELRTRADCLLLVGAKLSSRLSETLRGFDFSAPPHFDGNRAARSIVRLGAGRGDPPIDDAIEIAATAAALPQVLGCLRACLAGHPTRLRDRAATKMEEAAKCLKAAHFGVAVWSPESLDPLAIEMLYGLVKELNKTTRFTGLSLAPPSNGMGVVQTSGWMTGFPVRTGFGRGYPEHDSWRFDAMRMIESGETDIALWIAAYGAPALPWSRQVPFVALATPQTKFPYAPQVRFDIGTPGIDHDGVEHAPEIATFVLKRAQAKSDAAPVATVLRLIDGFMSEGGMPC